MDGRSPSGKAPDFGSGIEGSNPSRPASFIRVELAQVAKICMTSSGAVPGRTALVIFAKLTGLIGASRKAFIASVNAAGDTM